MDDLDKFGMNDCLEGSNFYSIEQKDKQRQEQYQLEEAMFMNQMQEIELKLARKSTANFINQVKFETEKRGDEEENKQTIEGEFKLVSNEKPGL